MTKKLKGELPPKVLEEMRRVCGELSSLESTRSIMLTAPAAQAGTTTITACLGFALAEHESERILLVDANVRNPQLHKMLAVESAPGLCEWDAKNRPNYHALPDASNVFVLPAGKAGHGPGFWAGHTRNLKALARRVKQEFDYILWDSAPVTSYPDAKSLASEVDGVLVVVESDKTRMDHLNYLREQMVAADAKFVGAIMNRSGRYLPGAGGKK